MRRWLVLGTALLACSPWSPAPPPPPAAGIGASTPAEIQCSATSCATSCDEQIADLRKPPASRYHRTFKGGRCVAITYQEYLDDGHPSGPAPPGMDAASVYHVRDFQRPGCRCLASDAPENDFVLAGREGAPCLVADKLGNCLLDIGDTPRCNLAGDDALCTAFCRQVQQRLDDEEARSYDATVQGSACEANHNCVCIARVADRCYDVRERSAYFRPWSSSPAQSCDLPVEQLARRISDGCASGCGAGESCLIGRCVPTPATCTPGTCPDGFRCYPHMRALCPGCPPSACVPKTFCDTLSPDCASF